ncbi:hypothetical protein V6N12_071399 [Hibiscus sabdariffa]|uniref:Uncharacterized protein n=1 Tax=Hibiscus sabdariffa TaxID=183260 RepID=A0ABR2FJY8_9ROSI
MGAAMDDDRDEFVAVGERTDVAAENEDDEDGHVTPIGTDKVPYATIVLESKDLDGGVARVRDQIDHKMRNAIIIRLLERSI